MPHGRGSELLDRRAQVEFQGQGAAVLPVELVVGLGDGIGLQQPAGGDLLGRERHIRVFDLAVDDGVGNAQALGAFC